VVGTPTSLKNDGVKVSWDDVFFPIYGKIKAKFQTTNQISKYGGTHFDPYLKICMGTIGINLGIPKYK
jgi:hypothetical protein